MYFYKPLKGLSNRLRLPWPQTNLGHVVTLFVGCTRRRVLGHFAKRFYRHARMPVCDRHEKKGLLLVRTSDTNFLQQFSEFSFAFWRRDASFADPVLGHMNL